METAAPESMEVGTLANSLAQVADSTYYVYRGGEA